MWIGIYLKARLLAGLYFDSSVALWQNVHLGFDMSVTWLTLRRYLMGVHDSSTQGTKMHRFDLMDQTVKQSMMLGVNSVLCNNLSLVLPAKRQNDHGFPKALFAHVTRHSNLPC